MSVAANVMRRKKVDGRCWVGNREGGEVLRQLTLLVQCFSFVYLENIYLFVS